MTALIMDYQNDHLTRAERAERRVKYWRMAAIVAIGTFIVVFGGYLYWLKFMAY